MGGHNKRYVKRLKQTAQLAGRVSWVVQGCVGTHPLHGAPCQPGAGSGAGLSALQGVDAVAAHAWRQCARQQGADKQEPHGCG